MLPSPVHFTCLVVVLTSPPVDQSTQVELRNALSPDRDIRVRRYAAWALDREQPLTSDTATALITTLRDPDELLAMYAAETLGHAGPTIVPDVLPLLTAAPPLNTRAQDTLVHIGAPAVGPLLGLLENSADTAVQRAAITTLGRLGRDAEAALPALLQRLSTSGVRARSVEIAVAIGQIGPAAIPQLTAMLHMADHPLARESACRALTTMGPAAECVLGEVLEIIEHGQSSRERLSAVRAAAAVAPGHGRTVAAARVALRSDPSASVRSHAAGVLGEIPGPDDDTISALIEALGDKTPVANAAVDSLGRIGGPAIPYLVAVARDSTADARIRALTALGIMGPRARGRIEDLIELFVAEGLVSEKAAWAVEQMGGAAVPALMKTLAGHASARVRGYAALVLGRLVPPADVAVPTLIDALADDAPKVRQIACWALGKIGPAAAAARPRLCTSVRSPDVIMRRTAVWALGNIGGPRPALAAVLEPALADDDPGVREEAAEALSKIRGTYVYPDAE